MPDIDKVLEAENAIKNIAQDLEKMKSAAELMDSSQKKIDAVIDTSRNIITNIGEFVKEGTQIVERIGDYDIQADLSKIIENVSKIKGDTIAISERFNEMKTHLINIKSELELFMNNKFTDIENGLKYTNVQNEKKNNIIIWLVGFNLLLGVIMLFKIFYFR